jgi:DNA-binding IclR family transcriptional regulator
MRNLMGKPFASLERAIDILSLFDSEHQGFSAQDVSEKLGMPLSTTYKYLDIFLKKGFLSKDVHAKKFSLGPTIFKMGVLAAEKVSFANVALPYMNSLSEKSGETVILTVIYGMEALCVDAIESPKMVRLTIKKGATLPLHAGASQKILLAYQDESFIDTLIESKGFVKLNENTITDPQQLKKELELIRVQGFTQSDSEVDAGAAAIAAPIFNQKGGVAAGLTVAGPSGRILGENRPKFIGMVTDSAQRISFELGYVEIQKKAS